MRFIVALIATVTATLCLTGCPTDPDTEWQIVNRAENVRWIEGEGGGPDFTFEVDRDGVLTEAHRSNLISCVRNCGKMPQGEACDAAPIDPDPSVLALLPAEDFEVGPSRLFVLDSDFFGSCRAEVSEGTTVFVSFCHGTNALDANGDLVAAPEFSGRVDEALELFDPSCETFEGFMKGSGEFVIGAEIVAE